MARNTDPDTSPSTAPERKPRTAQVTDAARGAVEASVHALTTGAKQGLAAAANAEAVAQLRKLMGDAYPKHPLTDDAFTVMLPFFAMTIGKWMEENLDAGQASFGNKLATGAEHAMTRVAGDKTEAAIAFALPILKPYLSLSAGKADKTEATDGQGY